jgi:large subunit ribosomal protein L23
MDRLYRVIQKPVITEKATDESAKRNAYLFRVPLDANKVEIRQAVEKHFNVGVVSVNTLRAPGKRRRRGWVPGQSPEWKKAMVKLAQGDTIEIL